MTALRQLPLYPVQLPATRADCIDGARPCPHSTCRHALPEGECALDYADEGPQTNEAIGQLLGLSRERVRQIEKDALWKIRAALGLPQVEREAYRQRPPVEGDGDDEAHGGGDNRQAIGAAWIFSKDEDEEEARLQSAMARVWRLYQERSGRRIGELTAELPKAPAGNERVAPKSGERTQAKSSALSDLGISKQR